MTKRTFSGDVVSLQGTKNLVDAAKAAGVTKFVLLSSLLTNAPAVGQADNPNYKFLNIFGGVLDHKLVAEKYLKASGESLGRWEQGFADRAKGQWFSMVFW
jgi:nucleoside-diphosphate-sugar epimerase